MHPHLARCVALTTLLLPAAASAGSLTTWGLQTGQGETWFTPYVFVDGGSVATSSYLSAGLGERADVIGGVSAEWTGQLDAGAVELTPRFFVHENIGLAVRLASVPGVAALEVGPEVHAVLGAGPFTLTTNMGWRPVVGDRGGPGSAFVVLAPEISVHDALSVYVEVNPAVDLTDGTASVSVVPGVGVVAGEHSFSVGLVIPTRQPAKRLVAGAWYSVQIGDGRACESDR